MLYLIEIPHQTTTSPLKVRTRISCILSKFHIKPQPIVIFILLLNVVSYRNSTSNHNYRLATGFSRRVVSYRNSTSNHNCAIETICPRMVVSYRNSTSNHNLPRPSLRVASLYLIEIPHQTTTKGELTCAISSCILSKFHIKPQHCV